MFVKTAGFKVVIVSAWCLARGAAGIKNERAVRFREARDFVIAKCARGDGRDGVGICGNGFAGFAELPVWRDVLELQSKQVID